MSILQQSPFNICFFLACLLFVFLLGCAGEPIDPEAIGRETVEGTILINGQPIAGPANISFIPLDASVRDAGGGGKISPTGKYSLTGRNGVKPGKYRVRIAGSATYDRRTGAPATPEMTFGSEYTVRLVPPEFNENSTLEFEVVAGTKNVFDYDMITSFVPNTTPPRAAPVE